jgi:quinol monooxygenase YgiN
MEDTPMRKLITAAPTAIAIAFGAWTLLPMQGQDAAAQGGPMIINAINLDIPADIFDKFMEVAKENAVASAKDPGCREFSIVVSKDDPHHIMFFEVYDNEAGAEFHRNTEHFKKYQATTRDMPIKRDVKRFMSVSMNVHGA